MGYKKTVHGPLQDTDWNETVKTSLHRLAGAATRSLRGIGPEVCLFTINCSVKEMPETPSCMKNVSCMKNTKCWSALSSRMHGREVPVTAISLFLHALTGATVAHQDVSIRTNQVCHQNQCAELLERQRKMIHPLHWVAIFVLK